MVTFHDGIFVKSIQQTHTHHTCPVGRSYLFKAVCVLLLNKVFAPFYAWIVIHSRYYSSSLWFGGQIWVQCIIIWEMKQWKTLPSLLGSPRRTQRNDSGIDILKYINRMALPFFSVSDISRIMARSLKQTQFWFLYAWGNFSLQRHYDFSYLLYRRGILSSWWYWKWFCSEYE